MDRFLLFLCMGVMGSISYSAVVTRFLPNPPRLRCTACGAIFYLRPHGFWRMALYELTYLMSSYVIVWRLTPPLSPLFAIALITVLIPTWNIAADRVRYAIFRWRHPIRCQGGGHLKPVPQPT